MLATAYFSRKITQGGSTWTLRKQMKLPSWCRPIHVHLLAVDGQSQWLVSMVCKIQQQGKLSRKKCRKKICFRSWIRNGTWLCWAFPGVREEVSSGDKLSCNKSLLSFFKRKWKKPEKIYKCLRSDFMSTGIWLSVYCNILIADIQGIIKENVSSIFSE